MALSGKATLTTAAATLVLISAYSEERRADFEDLSF
jgi:hypothetical protein